MFAIPIYIYKTSFYGFHPNKHIPQSDLYSHGSVFNFQIRIPKPETFLQETLGDNRAVFRSGIQTVVAPCPRVPTVLPGDAESEGLYPQLQPRDGLRHQVLHPGPAPEPPPDSPDYPQKA